MDLAWDDARAAFAAGHMGGAELACAFVADRVRRAAGRRWLQGPRRPALDPGADAPELVRLFATRELFGLPRAAPEALVAWAAGRRRVELGFSMPSPRTLLAMQARGRRCVSLLDDDAAPPGPKAAYGGGGLGFVVHDLCHLEKFADPVHHEGQVGFFAALDRALEDPRWRALESGFSDPWIDERDHVLADMNGSPVFLFVVLRNKMKLAVRRRVATERGEPCRRGELDEGEARAYAEAVEILLDGLGLDGPSREAARRLTSRHDADAVAADALAHAFTKMGAEVLARG
ncbi:Hypothetical protein A7982_03167 [Minicystis rosea]|nr:Hypothetical protein A7982_03167 [Minicystis rosea]